jgi:hypothetical protein
VEETHSRLGRRWQKLPISCAASPPTRIGGVPDWAESGDAAALPCVAMAAHGRAAAQHQPTLHGCRTCLTRRSRCRGQSRTADTKTSDSGPERVRARAIPPLGAVAVVTEQLKPSWEALTLEPRIERVPALPAVAWPFATYVIQREKLFLALATACACHRPSAVVGQHLHPHSALRSDGRRSRARSAARLKPNSSQPARIERRLWQGTSAFGTPSQYRIECEPLRGQAHSVHASAAA